MYSTYVTNDSRVVQCPPGKVVKDPTTETYIEFRTLRCYQEDITTLDGRTLNGLENCPICADRFSQGEDDSQNSGCDPETDSACRISGVILCESETDENCTQFIPVTYEVPDVSTISDALCGDCKQYMDDYIGCRSFQSNNYDNLPDWDENDRSTHKISYIVTAEDKVTPNETEQNYNICPKQAPNCIYDVDDNAYECTHVSLCPYRYHTITREGKAICVLDDETSCAGVNCKTQPGWDTGECSPDLKCVAESCIDGYHKYNSIETVSYLDGSSLITKQPWTACKPDSVEECGDKDINCNTYFLESEEPDVTKTVGVDSYICRNAECRVGICKEGYHWNRTNDGCEINSEKACGSFNHNCYAYGGWIENDNNICSESFDCISDKCDKGYHTYNKKDDLGFNIPCELDTKEHCGPTGKSCEPDEVCDEQCENDNCEYTCTDKCAKENAMNCHSVCVDIQNDPNNCGACDLKCTFTNAITTACTEAECIVARCAEDFHIFDNTCESNTTEHCGNHDQKCQTIAGAASMACKNAQCIAASCSSGYHLYNNSCEINSVSNCGKHGSNCTKSNATSVSCSSGTCQATKCKSGYHIYGNNCEAHSVSNCGKHGTTCTTSKVSYSTSVSCSSGTCKATKCKSGYKVSGGKCVKK